MKQIFLSQGAAVIKDVPQPLVDEHTVLVEVAYSCLSTGTERATLRATEKSLINKALQDGQKNIKRALDFLKTEGLWATVSMVQSKVNQLLDVGYSCSGRIIAVGNKISRFKVGDYVACAGAGFASHGQFVAVPEMLVARIKNEEKLRQASFSTVAAIALQGLRRADARVGETVAIVGCGLLGLLTLQLAKIAGLRTVCIDLDPHRINLARDLGADYAFTTNEQTASTDVLFATEHFGVDATLITASTSDDQLLNYAVSVTRQKGAIIIVGDVPLSLDRDELYRKEIDVRISTSYGPGRYDAQYELYAKDYPYGFVRWTEGRNLQYVADLISEGKLSLDQMIAEEFSFHQAPEIYEKIKQNAFLGAVINYSEIVDVVQEAQKDSGPFWHLPTLLSASVNDVVRVGVVGVGGFAKTRLLPLLARHPKAQIAGIVDLHIPTAVNIAQLYKVENYSNDYRHLLSDETIHGIVVATPHKYHADQLVDILQAGKAVFMEKPLVVNFDQLSKLKKLSADYPQAPWMVDFNRRYAPLIKDIKEQVMHRSAPLMMTYRMNAGYLPTAHWIQQHDQGGRIVGEVCHIVDLALFLVGRLITKIQVSVAGFGRADMLGADNLAIQCTFDDGSVCELVYVANGNAQLDKERLEIFWDGKSIVLDDYKILQGFGLNQTFNRIESSGEKGHAQAIDYWLNGIISGELAHGTAERNRSLYSTEMTLLIDMLARAGGGIHVIDHHQLATEKTSDHPAGMRGTHHARSAKTSSI